MDISVTFSDYAVNLEKEHSVKENIQASVKELEKTSYSINTVLERMHSIQGIQALASICTECRNILSKIPDQYEALFKQVPVGEFYKYHYHFKLTTQRLVCAVALVFYLEDSRLAKLEEVALVLGLKVKREDGFHLDLEDYLCGCLGLGQDLSRLAVNCVSAGDYTKPYQISQFLRDMNAAYSILNPKHELRKKFDELKYSVKKVEEVVYNLSLRGLKVPEQETSG